MVQHPASSFSNSHARCAALLAAGVAVTGSTAEAQIISSRVGRSWSFLAGSSIRAGGGCDAEGGLVALAVRQSGDGQGEAVAIATSSFCYASIGASFALIGSPVPSQPAAGFGARVALQPGDGTHPARVFIAAPLEDHPGLVDAGAVYCFVYDDITQNWGLAARITAPDAASGDRFGMALDADATTAMGKVVIGAPARSGGGAAYLAEVAMNETVSVVQLPAGALGLAARFGAAVAIDAPIVAVGAPDEGAFAGRVHLFDVSGAPVAREVLAGQGGGEGLGQSLSVAGTNLVAGAPLAAPTPSVGGGRIACWSLEGFVDGDAPQYLGDIRSALMPPSFERGFAGAVHLSHDGIHAGGVLPNGIYQVERINPASFTAEGLANASQTVLQTFFEQPYEFLSEQIAVDRGVLVTSVVSATTEPTDDLLHALIDVRPRLRDIDRDGIDDLLFAAPTTRRSTLWAFRGADDVPSASGMFLVGSAGSSPLGFPAGWRCVGQGDHGLGSVGSVWHDAATGHVKLVYSQGRFQSNAQSVLREEAELAIPGSVLAYADLDGDLNSDLLWKAADGAISAERIRFQSAIGTVSFTGAGAAAGYLGVADLLGAGRQSVLARPAGSQRLLALTWNGATVSEHIATDAITSTAIEFPATLDVAAAADFDLDGDDDLLVFNRTTRRASIWVMQFGQRVATRAVGTPLAAGWSIQGAADLDGDWDYDIVLRNAATGDFHRWRMNGLQRQGSAFVKRATPVWKLITEIEQRR